MKTRLRGPHMVGWLANLLVGWQLESKALISQVNRAFLASFFAKSPGFVPDFGALTNPLRLSAPLCGENHKVRLSRLLFVFRLGRVGDWFFEQLANVAEVRSGLEILIEEYRVVRQPNVTPISVAV